MIENPAKFNKTAALFAAVAGGLFALYLMGNVFFRLLELFDSIDYYLNHIGALLVELIAAVFLAFAFWIPCMETEKIPEAVETFAEN